MKLVDWATLEETFDNESWCPYLGWVKGDSHFTCRLSFTQDDVHKKYHGSEPCTSKDYDTCRWAKWKRGEDRISWATINRPR